MANFSNSTLFTPPWFYGPRWTLEKVLFIFQGQNLKLLFFSSLHYRFRTPPFFFFLDTLFDFYPLSVSSGSKIFGFASSKFLIWTNFHQRSLPCLFYDFVVELNSIIKYLWYWWVSSRATNIQVTMNVLNVPKNGRCGLSEQLHPPPHLLHNHFICYFCVYLVNW